VIFSGFSGELTGVSQELSASNLLAVMRKVEKPEQKPKHFLEIWNQTTLISSIETTEHHGEVYNDDFFGTLSWSPDESYVAFIAEQKEDEKKDAEAKFSYKETWGETYGKKGRPLLVIVNIKTKTVVPLKNLPGNPAQPTFTRDSKRVAFSSVQPEFERLGLIYCANRNTSIYSCDLEGSEIEKIGESFGSARSLRNSPDGEKLIFVANRVAGPHQSAARLYEYSWKNKTLRVVVDYIKSPKTEEFPGLYPTSLPGNCWIDSNFIVISSMWRSKGALLLVHLPTGQVQNLTPNTISSGSWGVLDVYEDIILAKYSAPNQPPNLALGRIQKKPANEPIIVQWTELSVQGNHPLKNLPLFDKIASYHWEVLRFSEKPHLEAILLTTSDQGHDAPLIVFPHGGPHSCFQAEFSTQNGTLLSHGFDILQVNYRGSTGFGDDALFALPGKIGDVEVTDTHFAATSVLEQKITMNGKEGNRFDKKRVYLFGGSHGGFTIGHLIGQYPGFYAAAAMRNPVTNAASMVDGTDISDWCYFEAGVSDDVSIPTEVSNTKMWASSPIAHISKVKTPTLIMLGEQDLRVPPYQGKNYHNLLKRLGVKTKLRIYPGENHALAGLEAEQDSTSAVVAFFQENSN